MNSKESLAKHWVEQLRYAEKLRENALKALSELAIEESIETGFRLYIKKLMSEDEIE